MNKILVRDVLFEPSSPSLPPLIKAKGDFRGRKRRGGQGSSHKGSHWEDAESEDQEWENKVRNERQEFVLENASIAPVSSPQVRTNLSEAELQARLQAEPFRQPSFWKDVLAGSNPAVQLPNTPPQPDENARSVEGIRRIWDDEIIGNAPYPGRRVQTPVGDVVLRPENFEHPFTEQLPHHEEPVLRRDRSRFIRYLVPTLENPVEVWADNEGVTFLGAYRRSEGGTRQIVVVTVPYGLDKQLKTMMATDKVDKRRKESELLWAKWREGADMGSGKIEKAALVLGRYRPVLAQSSVSFGQLRPTRDSPPSLMPLLSTATNESRHKFVPFLKAFTGGEDCPNCGASMEQGDGGECNSCGKPWPDSTWADPALSGDGGQGWHCPWCSAVNVSDTPETGRSCYKCKKTVDVVDGDEKKNWRVHPAPSAKSELRQAFIKGVIAVGAIPLDGGATLGGNAPLDKALVSGHFLTTHGGKKVWVEPYEDSRVRHDRPANEQKPRPGDSGVLFPEIGFVRPIKEPKTTAPKSDGLEDQLSLFEKARVSGTCPKCGDPHQRDDYSQACTGCGEHWPLVKAHASGFPLQGRLKFRGLDVSIENRKGSWRVDKAHTPPQWRTKMLCDYGYLRKTQGVDDDHLDVFVGPNENAPSVYIVNQLHLGTGEFDEQKFMLGFSSRAEAKRMYLAHYDTPKFFGSISEMPFEMFKRKALATLEATKREGSKGGLIKAQTACTIIGRIFIKALRIS